MLCWSGIFLGSCSPSRRVNRSNASSKGHVRDTCYPRFVHDLRCKYCYNNCHTEWWGWASLCTAVACKINPALVPASLLEPSTGLPPPSSFWVPENSSIISCRGQESPSILGVRCIFLLISVFFFSLNWDIAPNTESRMGCLTRYFTLVAFCWQHLECEFQEGAVLSHPPCAPRKLKQAALHWSTIYHNISCQ